MKYDEYDIQTACNIATGDDETTGKEVIRILKIITKEEVLIERKCFMCGTKANMGRFERYCSIHCRSKATKLDSTAHGIRFR